MKHWLTRLFPFFCLRFYFTFPLIIFLLVPLTAIWAQDHCTLLPLPLEERMQAAELVVEGKVVSQKSFWDSRHENIYTAHQVEIYKVFKGTPAQHLVEIVTEGGQVGLDIHLYSATLKLKPQQQGIFFLQPAKGKSANKRYEVFGSMQGFIQYQLTEQTAHDPFQQYMSIPLQVYAALRQLSGSSMRTVKPNVDLEAAIQRKTERQQNQRRLIPLITDFNPKSLRAGTEDVLTITGTNFGATRGNGYVNFRNADDGGATYIQPLPTDYISWTDTEIKVKVPSSGIDGGTAGTGTFQVVNNDPNTATSASNLMIVFAQSNVTYQPEGQNTVERSYQPRLFNKNAQGGYTFKFGANFDANKPALYAFKNSMNEWSCNTFVNWNTDSRTTAANTADDDINSVRFASNLPANVLGRTISRYSGCISNGIINFWVDEIDMEFAQRSDWQYGPGTPANRQFDFTSVAVHELGHGHQLSHLLLPRAVMHYAIAPGQVSRELNPANDVAGGMYIMARSINVAVCNVLPIVPKPANACAIPVERIVFQGQYQSANNTVLLQWETERETNLNQFVVERSADGITYTEIGRVPASGTTTTPRTYQFVDPAPFPFLAYYRLRLIKGTGTNEFSEVIEVTGPSFAKRLAPNPGGNQTFLYFDAPQTDQLLLDVFDTSGRKYASLSVEVVPEINRYELSLPFNGRGLFLIRWRSKQESGVFRYLKLE